MTIAQSPRPTPAPLSTNRWHGQLELDFAYRDQGTVVKRAFAQAPFKFQRPFYPEGGVCHGVMLHTAGGIAGGDRLTTRVHLHPHAHALLTTAAATKIYRSSGLEAEYSVHVRVEADACLEWLPQETIVFDAARYRQKMRVDLEPGAVWMGWEITRLGRSARGEQFASGWWRSHTEVWQQDQLLWLDPQGVAGGDEMMHSFHGLADCPVVASFAMVGRSLSPEVVARVRAGGAPTPEVGIESGGAIAVQTGVTRLTNGLICRYRGHSTLEARRWLLQVWAVLRQEVLGQPICRPRVW